MNNDNKESRQPHNNAQIQLTEQKEKVQQSNLILNRNRHYRYRKNKKDSIVFFNQASNDSNHHNNHTNHIKQNNHTNHTNHIKQNNQNNQNTNNNTKQNDQNDQTQEEHIIFIHDEEEELPQNIINSVCQVSHSQQTSQNDQIDKKDEYCQSEDWDVICCKLDKNCIVYFSQLGLIILCVCVSLFQITSGEQTNRDFFIGLLSSSLGYILPAPTLKKK